MDRFILQHSEKPNHWVCTDTVNKVVCVFEYKKFNDTQKFTLLENIKRPDAQILAEIAREMADWLRENHYGKAMP